jgi:galactokinase
MKQVAAFFGCAVLPMSTKRSSGSACPALRGQVKDRALLRAIHFFQDKDRVRLQSDALRRRISIRS